MTLSRIQKYFVKINLVCFTILQTTICETINANVESRIEGEGFHRSLKYQINFDNQILGCYVSIYLELPSGLYVNVNELSNLRSLRVNTACLIGETNIDMFSEKAEIQKVTVCSFLNDIQCIMKLPVHQRYQYASKNNRYVNITLPKPKLLLGCRKRIKEYRISKIDLCSPCTKLIPKWREIPYIMHTEHVWIIPAGDTMILPTVTYTTLLLTILCTIYLMQTILKSMSKQHQKKE
ncbi:uncharacterized protein LOC114881164 isoform X1 [Osmia bicornis bicornis]|uniref:uncharacterized protein LOC114881164 isoform X1 n=1 Tax=Osmia bicornis bicornis TaxID=1437191 RepID=UPI0010F8806A|nr:uncharacterized protein LOC114881164 isoform X1 [Osmia bicornis bicornis]